MAEPKDDPSTESSDYRAMSAVWTLTSDILNGAAAIRAKGVTYLPKYEDEDHSEYERRRKTAPWRPEFADALRSLSSKPFGKDVSLKEGASDAIKEIAEDVDGRGNSLTVFAQEAFGKGIAKGFHAILVDFPTMEPDGARPTTRADEQAAGVRPYWVQVQADDIIALYTRWENGREIVAHVRIRECVIEQDGFAEIEVRRIRVLEPGLWQIWEKRGQAADYSKIAEGLIARGGRAATSVPLALFFTGEREGEMRVKPPLADLGQMQIELYQALSRQDEVLTFAGSPMLAANGLAPPTDGSTVSVGPKRILFAPPGGDNAPTSWDFIQPDAANITEIRSHVGSIIDDMRRLGMQPLTQQSGDATATGQSIEAAKAHSSVKSWALRLKDSLEQAFVFTSEWMSEDTKTEVIVSTDFSVLPYAQAPLNALQAARTGKDISRRTFWEGLKRFDVLAPDFDPEAEDEALAEEEQGLEPEEEIDPATGQIILQPLPGNASRPDLRTA